MAFQFQPRTHTSNSGKQTVMNMVAPGDITGEYYILVCNLPFRIKWQNLKDWIRTQCPGIDMVVQVYRSSCCGWIKVHGRQNFETVFKHVDGGEFRGRALFASGRNATEYVPIKELIRPSQKTNPIYCSPDLSSQNGMFHESMPSPSVLPTSHQMGSEQPMQPDYPEVEPIPRIQIHAAEDMTVSSDSGGIASSTIGSPPPYDHEKLMPVSPEPICEIPHHYTPDLPIYYGYQAPTYHATGPGRIASDCIKPSSNPSIPVLRRIKLRNLPTSVPVDEVDSWIKSTVGPRFVQIEVISIRNKQAIFGDIPLQRTATVICKDAEVSKVLLFMLDGAEFHTTNGEYRTIMAKLPTKGVTVWEVNGLINDPSTTSVGRSLQASQRYQVPRKN